MGWVLVLALGLTTAGKPPATAPSPGSDRLDALPIALAHLLALAPQLDPDDDDHARRSRRHRHGALLSEEEEDREDDPGHAAAWPLDASAHPASAARPPAFASPRPRARYAGRTTILRC